MKKIKEWMPKHFEIAQGSDIAIILYDVWDKMAESLEAAQKMIDDEMDKDNQEIESYKKDSIMDMERSWLEDQKISLENNVISKQ